MDWQTLGNIGLGAVLAVIGWFVKGVKDDHKSLSADVNAFRLEVAKEYVTHTDLGDIKQTLFRIETKLDAKQDK